jgi:GH24 family phage-related lysozyme (muramidase)
MLLVDGDFGPSTEAAVVDARRALGLPDGVAADDELLAALARVPEPSAELTAAGVTFIAREEVSSPAEYRRKYSHPTWPSPSSGITIGIGYDLRFVTTREKLAADWGEVLPPPLIDRLMAVAGRPGSRALLKRVTDVEVPLLGAVRVFLGRMMPEHIGHTRRAYPTLDTLPAHRRTALVSLVFNRGGELSGERRREMARIRELLAAGQLEPVARQLEAMTRLWHPVREGGVIERRRREARLWRDGFEALQLA